MLLAMRPGKKENKLAKINTQADDSKSDCNSTC